MRDEYRKAYLALFNAVTDALDAMREKNYGQAEEILRAGQIRAEEDFIRAGEDGHKDRRRP